MEREDLLRLILADAREERQRLHDAPAAPLERKRAIATAVTKLEEAEMWFSRFEKLCNTNTVQTPTTDRKF